MTIADLLVEITTKLTTFKTDMINVLQSKGIMVDTTTSFNNYPELIANMDIGSGGVKNLVIIGINVENLVGKVNDNVEVIDAT